MPPNLVARWAKTGREVSQQAQGALLGLVIGAGSVALGGGLFGGLLTALCVHKYWDRSSNRSAERVAAYRPGPAVGGGGVYAGVGGGRAGRAAASPAGGGGHVAGAAGARVSPCPALTGCCEGDAVCLCRAKPGGQGTVAGWLGIIPSPAPAAAFVVAHYIFSSISYSLAAVAVARRSRRGIHHRRRRCRRRCVSRVCGAGATVPSRGARVTPARGRAPAGGGSDAPPASPHPPAPHSSE